jgi:PheRS DNA binding domain 1
MDDLEPRLLARLHEQGEIADTDQLAQQLGVMHPALVPTIKSLDSYEMVCAQVGTHPTYVQMTFTPHPLRTTWQGPLACEFRRN